MKHYLLSIIVLLFSFSFFAQDVDITVANGNSGFEEDSGFPGWFRDPANNTTGYDLEIDTSGDHKVTGQNSLHYKSTSGETIQQTISAPIKNLIQGQTYALTFWTDGTEANVYVLEDKEDIPDGEDDDYEIDTTDGTFVFHTMLFTAKKATMHVKFYFKNHDGVNGYPMYVDDVNVLPIVGGGNFGFELDDLNWERAVGWWPTASNNVEIIELTPSIEGVKCAYYDGGSAAYNQFYSYIAGLRIGKKYTLVFQAAGTFADLWVGPMSNVYEGYYINVVGDGSETKWIQQTLNFTATETSMLLWFDFAPGQTLRVDDIHVVQNIESGKLLINEVNSNPTAGASYVELYNSTENNLLLQNMQIEVYKDNNILPDITVDFPDDIMGSITYIVVTNNNAAFQALYGSPADYEFLTLDLNNLDGLIIRQATLGIVDQFNDVPQPNPDAPEAQLPIDNHHYLRKGFNIENGGANLNKHWCDVGADRIGTPGAPNTITWDPLGIGIGVWEIPQIPILQDVFWGRDYAPCECEDVVITGSTSIITEAGAKARNVKVESGGSLIMLADGKLSIGTDSIPEQNLIILSEASLTVEGGASINIDGLELSPFVDFTINGENAITKLDQPIVGVSGNESIGRVYTSDYEMLGFSGSVTVNYEDDINELNGIDESKLVLEVNEGGTWNNYSETLDTGVNTISVNFGSINFLGITASSSEATLPVEEFENKTNIIVYPNPATSEITISGKLELEIEVYNVLGQMVLTPKSKKFSVSGLPEGTYFLKIMEIESFKTKTYKFIKQ